MLHKVSLENSTDYLGGFFFLSNLAKSRKNRSCERLHKVSLKSRKNRSCEESRKNRSCERLHKVSLENSTDYLGGFFFLSTSNLARISQEPFLRKVT